MIVVLARCAAAATVMFVQGLKPVA